MGREEGPYPHTADGTGWRTPLACGVMVASGFAGLGYQIVWTQQGALWLGHEAAAVLAVVTALFGGLALGALALGGRIERSRRPERWYAACEAVIALWCGALAWLTAPVSGWLLDVTGAQPTASRQGVVAFLGTFGLLLPASAAMGATLPAMERVVARLGRQRRSIALLYACNTAGAVVGVLAAAFWLVPAFGLARTAAVCAALNVLCAAASLRLFAVAEPRAASATAGIAAPAPAAGAWRALGLLAATGLLGIGYEVLVVRVLGQLTENTVYTFALLLAVYLLGSALGAAGYSRWATGGIEGGRAGRAEPAQPDHADRAQPGRADPKQPSRSDPAPPGRSDPTPRTGADPLRDRLLCLLAAACLLGTVSLWQADAIRDLVLRLFPQSAAGAGIAGALTVEAALALAAFGPPTVLMGALFSHLASTAQRASIGFGRALGYNTLGAAAAPLLFGVAVVPALGAKAALLLIAAGYLALSSRRAWLAPNVVATGATAAALAGLAVWAPPLVFVDLPDGGRIVSYREGVMAAVSVVEDAQGVSRLFIDNHQQEGSSASRPADARQALLPLLLHPAPRRALFLGLGTGVTASAAAEDPTLQVDAAELLPEVIAASAHFTGASAQGPGTPRLHVVAADARRFVRATATRYDVIVSDNFHPARSGSGALYTVEHFRAVRARLAPGGVFCQWLPLHQLDLPTLRSIVRSFLAAYSGGRALLATNSLETPVLGLLAGADAGDAAAPSRIDLQRLRERLAGHALPQRLADFGIADEFAVLGSLIAGPRALARFAGDAPLNTDDRPVVAYRAPRITYVPDSVPADRLLALLRELAAEPAESPVDAGADAAWPQRLAAYGVARDRFLAAGRGVRRSADAAQMLSQVREPLLAVLRISPDFRPAYDPLMRMATALARSDPAAARALLTALADLQPAQPDAAAALRAIEPGPAAGSSPHPGTR